MTGTTVISQRLQIVLNELEKIIAELDRDPDCGCTCQSDDFLTRKV